MTRIGLARWLSVLLLLLPATASVRAEEPAAEFMEALRENGYFDVALEYLEAMADSPLVEVEFKESLEYERGITLMAQSRLERDVAKRETQLDKAGEAFKTFVNLHPDHPQSDSCNQQLGNLLVERGRAKLARAEKVANKAPLKKEARKFFDEAYLVFAKAQNDLKEKLSEIPKILDPKRDGDLIALRDRLRRDYLQSQLLSAAILEETADALEASDPERKTLLEKASDEYSKIYEKYRTRIAGSYALLYQGRCDQKLGRHKDALSFFTELMDQPDEPEDFRKLKVRATNYAMESWAAEDKLAVAVNKSIELLKTERPNEMQDMSWTELKVRMGRAAKDYIKQLQAKDPKDPQIRLIRADARKLIQPATKRKTDYQDEARRLVAEFQGVDPEAIAEQERPEPTTFIEAKERGKEALDSLATSQLVLKTVPQRITREKDPAIKADLEKQVAAAQENLKTGQAEAKKYFQLALQLVTPESPPEEVNIVRYFLCYLFYKDQEYIEAALVGEFVSTRAPGSAGARQSAKIALASYINLYSANASDDKTFETNRIMEVADFIIKKWPEQQEAEEAINTIIPFLIQDGKLEEALGYVERIPEDSPRRGEVELKVGQALWSSYLQSLQQARAADPEAALPPELEEKKADAKKVLSAGISRMEKAGVSEQLVAAALSLAQISVDGGDAANAIQVMEHPTYGLVRLAQEGHPATKKDGVAEEIYKTALRAYIGSLAEGGGDRDAAIESAKQMMAGLKTTVADPKKLVGTYVSLARSLEKQIKLADPQKRKVLSDVFAEFLKEVGAEAQDFSVLNWVAETFSSSLGDANLDASGKPTDAAKAYYAEAAKTFEKMVQMADTPGFLPQPGLKTHLQMKLATTFIGLGKFVEAKTQIIELLEANEMNVSVQIAAAEMYQEWAGYPEKEEIYKNAIYGAEKKANGRNLVWGWGKLAKLTQGKEKFANVFHSARIQLATSRYKWAMASDPTQKKRYLKLAKNDVVLTQKAYPELGGAAWKAQYDKILKTIQTALGEPATGIAGLEEKS